MLEQPPVYIVLFSSSDLDLDAPPVLIGESQGPGGATVPHGLSYDVVKCLPALWYCLHLPASFIQVLDLSVIDIKRSQQLSLGHNIWLAPVSVFESYWPDSGMGRYGIPVLLIAPDEEIVHVKKLAKRLKLNSPIASYSELSQESLRHHWRHIRSLLPSETYQIEEDIELTRRIDTGATAVPYSWLARQIRINSDGATDASQEVITILRQQLEALLMVSVLAKLEADGVSRDVADSLLPDYMQKEIGRLSVPIAVGFPGVPSIYTRRVYAAEARASVEEWPQIDVENNWENLCREGISDTLAERSAIEFLVAHRATARGGIGLMLKSVPQRLFQIVDQIERHCISKAYGPTVWKLLRRLYSASEEIWNEEFKTVIARASHLTVFSNFPVGLLRIPGASAPILSRTPVSYRPIIPLTRAIQHENDSSYSRSFPTRNARILVVECISPSDPVGISSRIGWKTSKEYADTASRSLEFQIREVSSVDALKVTLRENPCDILVISAHGFYDVEANVAGLKVGNESTIGVGLGPLPSVVILSACHVSPMGIAAVRVVDMMLREGAIAILGTQIPVDVRHNATLMARFFVYLAEALNGDNAHTTLADAWQHVQASNPINDIINSNRHLAKWLLEKREGVPTRLAEFMLSKSAGRLRATHIYEDTESVIIEMAEAEGKGEVVRRWLTTPGYLPESMFYAFWGSPERVFLNYPPGEIAMATLVDDDRSP